ncbi:NAD-dependent epimerase/dehydratase family protein [Pseudactinotalea suaedae]|uniref:NAD-dependent epimerase/dehydratase family protein n=1 Tax=Pseudactinotalea suaedae TaxID=1524924 RepID=UPI0012E326CF|nr:NAD(P)-dependent oxidoreductase [Pseudactinotalea suaedae]
MSPRLLTFDDLPASFADVDDLEEFMSRPTAETVAELAALEGDVIVLGVAGKMGVGLATLVKRAAPGKRVVGVARFSEEGVQQRLEDAGVETIVADLLDPDAVEALPKLPNVLYMAGLKFDGSGREDLLWAMNTLVPSYVGRAFRNSRIVALSTIHVYPWSDPRQGGVDEETPPTARPGEYANSVVGRERVFQYLSRRHGTPGRIVRFVYAIDMRYGVMQEVATWVRDGVPIPLATGNINVQWQGDAINAFARLLTRVETPTTPINIGGPENISIRRLAQTFGRLLGVEPVFEGTESDLALLVNCDRALAELGNPVVPVERMTAWVADWVARDQPTYGKPSKFQVRNGIF